MVIGNEVSSKTPGRDCLWEMVSTVTGREGQGYRGPKAIGRTICVDTEITEKSYVVLESDSEPGSRIFQVCEGVDFLQWGKKTGLVWF